MTEKEMIDMPVNTTGGVDDVYIRRVPGGWIYYNWDYEKDCPVDVGTYVPLPNVGLEVE